MNQTSLPSAMGGLLPASSKPMDKISGDSHLERNVSGNSHLESENTNARFKDDMKEAHKEIEGDKSAEQKKTIEEKDKASHVNKGSDDDFRLDTRGGSQETTEQVTTPSAGLEALDNSMLSTDPMAVDGAAISMPVTPLSPRLLNELESLPELELGLDVDTVNVSPLSPLSTMIASPNVDITKTTLPLQPHSTIGLQSTTLLNNPAILNKILGEKGSGVVINLLDNEAVKEFDLTQMTKDIEKPLPSTTPVLSPLTNKISAELLPTNPISLNTSFQSAGQWGQAVTDQVMWMSSKGIKEATIQLDPPELGSLQVKVGVNQDQAQVSFTVQHASVREALDQQSTRLREMFAEEGLNLADVDVSDQSQQQDKDAENEGRSGYGQQNSSDEERQVTTITPIQSGQQSYSLVDAYI